MLRSRKSSQITLVQGVALPERGFALSAQDLHPHVSEIWTSFIATFDNILTTKEDIVLSRLGTAKREGSMLSLAGATVAIDRPDDAAVCLSWESRVRLFLSLITLLFAASAYPSTPSPQEKELYAGLLNWAVVLSGYPRPATTPTVEFVPQEFFNENACHHRECHVWGWYPNTGHDVIYVHEAVRELLADGTDPRSLLAASIIVHEFTHYLQAVKRGFAAYRCEEAIDLEREAYGVQNAYIVSYGRYLPIGVSLHYAGCGGSASESAIR